MVRDGSKMAVFDITFTDAQTLTALANDIIQLQLLRQLRFTLCSERYGKLFLKTKNR